MASIFDTIKDDGASAGVLIHDALAFSIVKKIEDGGKGITFPSGAGDDGDGAPAI